MIKMEEYDSESEDCILNELSNELECQKYSKIDLKAMTCFFIYVDVNRSLKFLDKSEIKLSIPNTLLKNELQSVIRNRQKKNEKSYKLVHLFKYNFNIDENEIRNHEKYNFLDSIELLTDVSFHPSVEVMSDINGLFFVFNETNQINKTKKHITFSKNNKTNKNLR
tara:strand:+ start:877 stop:1374 length:498 start_codon:yes stop_codon:yes gene_type:complete